ncbi:MAG: lysylphosphatidylglycerol synthase transmembrane domain-containing protein, partial [Chthoniobacterales bacterium]
MTSDASPLQKSEPPGKRVVISVLQLAISVGLLIWIASDISSRNDLFNLIADANVTWIGIAIFSAAVGVSAGMIRWRVFLEMLGLHLTWRRLASVYLIGHFFDLFLLGATGGDAAKAVCVIREYPERKTAALMSIAMDHMSGLGALLAATAFFTLDRANTFLAHPVTAVMFWFLIGYVSLAVIGIAICIAISRFPIPAWLPLPGRLRSVANDMQAAFVQM